MILLDADYSCVQCTCMTGQSIELDSQGRTLVHCNYCGYVKVIRQADMDGQEPHEVFREKTAEQAASENAAEVLRLRHQVGCMKAELEKYETRMEALRDFLWGEFDHIPARLIRTLARLVR